MKPETWHYGLVAKWWSEFNDDFGRTRSCTSRRSSSATASPLWTSDAEPADSYSPTCVPDWTSTVATSPPT